MTQAEHIVSALLSEDDEAAEFMNNVGFDSTQQGKMFVLQKMNIIDGELDELKAAVIRRTAELMPNLVKRGIVDADRAHVIAKLLTYYIADQQYNPKLWDASWLKIYKQMVRVIKADTGWGRTLLH